MTFGDSRRPPTTTTQFADRAIANELVSSSRTFVFTFLDEHENVGHLADKLGSLACSASASGSGMG
jgi:hypothetical protein